MKENHVELDGVSHRQGNLTGQVATLGYYETYALFAMTKRNVKSLSEKTLKGIKLHKKKLFFIIYYDDINDKFSLASIIYNAPLSKCIKIINAIIARLNDDDIYSGKEIRPKYVKINLLF